MVTVLPDRIHGHNVKGIKVGDGPATWDMNVNMYEQISGDEIQGIVKEMSIGNVTPDAEIVQYLGRGTSSFDSSVDVANDGISIKRQGLLEIELTVDHNDRLLELLGYSKVTGTEYNVYLGGSVAQYGSLKTLGINIVTSKGKTINVVLADAFLTLEGPKISADGSAEYTLRAKGMPSKYAVQVDA